MSSPRTQTEGDLPQIVITTSTPLSNEQITAQLQKLRKHALVASSGFAVSALIEIKLSDGRYAYVSGVNVESHEHNRLSLHAEQNALATAQAYFGGNVHFSKIFAMGGNQDVQPGSDDPEANQDTLPCGHCRQILQSSAAKENQVYAVTINGKMTPQGTLGDLLPHSFSEQNLGLIQEKLESAKPPTSDPSGPTLFHPVKRPTDLLTLTTDLSEEEIQQYLSLPPYHSISKNFETSPVTRCILKLSDPTRYALAVLVQDIAFLTTDAIFAVIGQAITRSGAEGVFGKIDAIYCYTGDSKKEPKLCAAEKSHLHRFMAGQKMIPMHFYDSSGKKTIQPLYADPKQNTPALEKESMARRTVTSVV